MTSRCPDIPSSRNAFQLRAIISASALGPGASNNSTPTWVNWRSGCPDWELFRIVGYGGIPEHRDQRTAPWRDRRRSVVVLTATSFLYVSPYDGGGELGAEAHLHAPGVGEAVELGGHVAPRFSEKQSRWLQHGRIQRPVAVEGKEVPQPLLGLGQLQPRTVVLVTHSSKPPQRFHAQYCTPTPDADFKEPQTMLTHPFTPVNRRDVRNRVEDAGPS